MTAAISVPPVYTDAPAPWRKLACALLLGGALGAYARDQADAEWVNSDFARRLADAVDLPEWPPRAEQLGSRRDLVRRASLALPDLDGPVGSLSLGYLRDKRRKAERGADQVIR
jgi:hypothetical protein